MKALLVLVLVFCYVGAQQVRDVPAKETGKPVTKTTFSATTDFAFDLYKKFATASDGTKNIFFSPLSIYIAFAMLKAGARGTSSSQMENVMNWQRLEESYGSEEGHEAVERLLAEVFSPLENNNTISVANKLWIQEFFCSSLCNNFINLLRKTYNADMSEVNFARDPERARQKVNKWVEGITNQKIKDLLPKGSISSLTRFVLANAIYFKSKWKTEFDEKMTKSRDFNAVSKGDGLMLKKVPTMHMTGNFLAAGFNEASPYQILEMPYEGETISMLLIVPQNMATFRLLEKSMSSVELSKMINELEEFESLPLNVYLPKFKISTDLNLKEHLIDLGMKDIFSRKNADLSGVTQYKGMFVSNAVHKAYVKVDEQGTEAAAATGISVDFRSLLFEFRVDRPFLFMIRHKQTNTILFMGRVMDPTIE